MVSIYFFKKLKYNNNSCLRVTTVLYQLCVDNLINSLLGDFILLIEQSWFVLTVKKMLKESIFITVYSPITLSVRLIAGKAKGAWNK